MILKTGVPLLVKEMRFTDCPYINYTLSLLCGYNSQATLLWSFQLTLSLLPHMLHIHISIQSDIISLFTGIIRTIGRMTFKNSTFLGMAWVTYEWSSDNANSLQDIIGQGYTKRITYALASTTLNLKMHRKNCVTSIALKFTTVNMIAQ